MVTRKQICGTELAITQLVRMVQPLRMPSMDSDWPKNPENQTGESKNNTGHSVMENSNMVPESSEHFGITPVVLKVKTAITDSACRKSPLSNKKAWCLMVWRISGASSTQKISQITPLKSPFQTKVQLNADPGTIL
ncbi:hypothetical protein AYI70_g7128 [Smittium culicis]|uniref:Uncharacterized protein n=1 Tax=Smittium culicis TaxID=133412 RepID=A0A1R1XM15_9FUNG|nr:hypothetical protein AYI70_g8246 [Smittium culicis]OMJ15645.1 hypothetical protein AYI70_g7128 [Smittium culicis]